MYNCTVVIFFFLTASFFGRRRFSSTDFYSSPNTYMADSWSEISADYELLVEPFTSSFTAELLSLTKISGASVLDVGCGPGTVAMQALAGGATEVAATDYALGMVERVIERTSGKVQAVCAPGDELPSDWEKRFDAVVSCFGVIFFPNVVAGLKEMHRCCKPGGAVLVSAWGSAAETAAFRIFPTALADLGLQSPDPAKARADGSPLSLTTLLEEAGFENVQVHGPVTRQLRVVDGAAFFDRFARGAPGTRKVRVLRARTPSVQNLGGGMNAV